MAHKIAVDLSHGDVFCCYRRVIDARAPLAIVIPTRGFTYVDGLRAGDISWHDFLRRAKLAKYELLYVCLVFPFNLPLYFNLLIFSHLMPIFVLSFS